MGAGSKKSSLLDRVTGVVEAKPRDTGGLCVSSSEDPTEGASLPEKTVWR